MIPSAWLATWLDSFDKDGNGRKSERAGRAKDVPLTTTFTYHYVLEVEVETRTTNNPVNLPNGLQLVVMSPKANGAATHSSNN